MVIGGILGKPSIKLLGQRMHTTSANLANAAGMLVWSSSTSLRGLALAIFLATFGQRKRDAVESMCVRLSPRLAIGIRGYRRYSLGPLSLLSLVFRV